MMRAWIGSAGVASAAGDSVPEVWEALRRGEQRRSRLPFPTAGWLPYETAFHAPVPELGPLGVDRRQQRTMVEQAQQAFAAACRAVRGPFWEQLTERERVGLFLGVPVIDREIPTWECLEELGSSGARELPLETMLRMTPPLHGLTLLNSSVCAHLAARFGFMGPVAAYSHFADAGLQALIEAALSLQEGECPVALVGGVAAELNPFLFLHLERLGRLAELEQAPVPGDGAACLTLSGEPPRDGGAPVCVAGYGRSFAGSPPQVAAARAVALRQALAMAGIEAEQLDWVMLDVAGAPGGRPAELRSLGECMGSARPLPALGSSEYVCGMMGPATPVLHAALAAYGMAHGRRLRVSEHGVPIAEDRCELRHVLINASGYEGQLVSVILRRGDS